MSQPAPRPQSQPEEVASLGELMQSATRLPEAHEEAEAAPLPARKQKPKQKPRVTPRLSRRHLTRLALVSAVLLIIVGAAVLFVAPVRMETSGKSSLVGNEVISFTLPEADLAAAQPITEEPSALVGRWLLTAEPVGNIPAATYVKVLSLDATGRVWVNVADMNGNLAIALRESLRIPAEEPAAEIAVPVGPFADAIGSLDRRVRLLDTHGVFAAGTEVTISGWRAEDGLWIYEVTLDGTHVEFVPAAFLEWVE